MYGPLWSLIAYGVALASGGSHTIAYVLMKLVILGLDLAGTVLHCDRGATSTLAREPADLLGAKLRDLIDQYSADKGKLPQSLDDLVSAGYLRQKPIDPITEKDDWSIVTGDDPYSSEGGSGVTDVHSSSGETSTEGTPYSEW